MSEFCLVNISDEKLSYEKSELLAKEVVKLSIKNGKGVYFNTEEFEFQKNMTFYFVICDGFISRNCDFLFSPVFCIERKREISKRQFCNKYSIFNKVLGLLKKNGMKKAEVYFSSDGVADFEEETVELEGFLGKVYEDIYKNEKEYALQFPSIKYVVRL